LHLEIGGSGKVAVGLTKGAHVEIGGSGDAQFGAIAGGLSVDIGGSGDVSAASVNGPTHVDIAGSGSVKSRMARRSAACRHHGRGEFHFWRRRASIRISMWWDRAT
jgi:hypothetical protein